MSRSSSSSSSNNGEELPKKKTENGTDYKDNQEEQEGSSSTAAAAASSSPALAHETHCTSCINVRACRKLMNSGTSASSCCPIVRCRLQCSPTHVFHACKAGEHEEFFCPRKIVPCLNVENGCPLKMERRYRAAHLQTCPASVVVCTVEWNRKPLAPWQTEHYETYATATDKSSLQQEAAKDLDIAAMRRDEQSVKQYYKLLPQSLRSLLKSNEKKQTIMPLGIAGTRIPNSILAQTLLEKAALIKTIQNGGGGSGTNNANTSSTPSNATGNLGDHDDEAASDPGSSDSSSSSDEDDTTTTDSSSLISYSEPSYGIRRSPSAGLQQSVCSQLTSPTPTATGWVTAPAAAAAAPPPHNSATAPITGSKKSRVRLSPIVDVVVKDACKYMKLFTFMCAHEFRRDEFPGHFQTVHTEINTQLNGWLYTRCPMAVYGCDFAVERMYPTAGGTAAAAGQKTQTCQSLSSDSAAAAAAAGAWKGEIVFNQPLDSFCCRSQLTDKTAPVEINHDNHQVEEHINSSPSPLIITNICDLPVELLVHLTQYLDPLSLNALSLTNQLFLAICQTIVTERGIVVFDWEKKDYVVDGDGDKEKDEVVGVGGDKKENDKDEVGHDSDKESGVKRRRKTGWVVADKRWMFSKYFTPIRKWGFIQPGILSNHLAHCEVFAKQRNRPSKPFCYPVTKDNL